jgi:hypothetical protein
MDMSKALAAALCLALAGCATLERETAAPAAGVAAAAPRELSTMPEQGEQSMPSASVPPIGVPPQEAPTAKPAAKALPPTHSADPSKPAAKAVLPAQAAETVSKPPMPPVVALVPEPPLDIGALKLRLRQTKAIGALAKLSLNSQMDDLLKRFRAVYQSGQTSVAALRAPYESLVSKVVALLLKGDPGLANSIASSREAIWAILSDREKFDAAS